MWQAPRSTLLPYTPLFRSVALPGPAVPGSWSEYSPKAVMLPPGRGDAKVLPSTRVVPGVKLKESQALAAVVQLKVTFCAVELKTLAVATETELLNAAVEAYQLPPISTAMRNQGIPKLPLTVLPA